jgi:HD superfamily phosphodiesterase
MDSVNSKIIARVADEMMRINLGDVQRIDHALKVYAHAKNIGTLEELGETEQFRLELAALLHDIGIQKSLIKYGSSDGRYQEIEGPAIAREILGHFTIDKNIVERVCFLVGRHHTYSAIDGADFQVLVESDFLVNAAEEFYSDEMIVSVREKIFKTKAGTDFLMKMFPVIA